METSCHSDFEVAGSWLGHQMSAIPSIIDVAAHMGRILKSGVGSRFIYCQYGLMRNQYAGALFNSDI